MMAILPLVEVLHPGMMALATRTMIVTQTQRADQGTDMVGSKMPERPYGGVSRLVGRDTHLLLKGELVI